MFTITNDRVNVRDSHNLVGYRHGRTTETKQRFRLVDDDGQIYLMGWAAERTYTPLDVMSAMCGCTDIEYYSPSRKRWETL